MMASFRSLETEMPFKTRKPGTTGRDSSGSVARTITLGRRVDRGKNGSLPKSTSSTNTDWGPAGRAAAAAAAAAARLLSAQPHGEKSAPATISGANEVSERCMGGRERFKKRSG